MDAQWYNVPTSSEVAIIIPLAEGVLVEARQIRFELHGGGLRFTNPLHSAYQGLKYPPLFPYG